MRPFDQLEKQLASEYWLAMNRKRLTVAQIKRIKAKSRVNDLARIRKGSATPDQIQSENALFSPEEAQSYRITNLAQVIDGICKKPIAR